MLKWILVTSTLLIAEKPPPVSVPGFILLRVCDANPNNQTAFPEWVYVAPSAIISVSRPPGIPTGCSAINTITGRRIFFYGSEYDIVIKTIQAVKEQRKIE